MINSGDLGRPVSCVLRSLRPPWAKRSVLLVGALLDATDPLVAFSVAAAISGRERRIRHPPRPPWPWAGPVRHPSNELVFRHEQQ